MYWKNRKNIEAADLCLKQASSKHQPKHPDFQKVTLKPKCDPDFPR